MISRGSKQHWDAAEILGRRTPFPAASYRDLSIPCDYYKHLSAPSLQTKTSAEEVIAEIFRLIGNRGRVTQQCDNGWYRAWFLTGASGQSFDLVLPHSEGILYAFGGECLQQIRHTHYVCVTDQLYSVADMRVKNPAFKVEGVQKSVSACVCYIKSQLVESIEPYIEGKFVEWSKAMPSTFPRSYHRPIGSQDHKTMRKKTPLKVSNKIPRNVDPQDYVKCLDIPSGSVLGNSPTVVVTKFYSKEELQRELPRIAQENPHVFHLIIPNKINPWS